MYLEHFHVNRFDYGILKFKIEENPVVIFKNFQNS